MLYAVALGLNYFECHDMLADPLDGQVLALHVAICRELSDQWVKRSNGLNES